MAKKSLRQRLGDPPVDDSLAAISWMQRALAAMASDVLDSNLTAGEKRDEMLKIADRMSRLRDPDRIYQAEKALRGRQQKRDQPTAGPEMKSAATFDTAAGAVGAIRGRPRRGGLS